jgi:hypothetical protein
MPATQLDQLRVEFKMPDTTMHDLDSALKSPYLPEDAADTKFTESHKSIEPTIPPNDPYLLQSWPKSIRQQSFAHRMPRDIVAGKQLVYWLQNCPRMHHNAALELSCWLRYCDTKRPASKLTALGSMQDANTLHCIALVCFGTA